ncbi:Serine/arginine repetitive matrix protein 1, partial [Eufriesea mexicana]
GTTASQDTRFSDKEKKLLKQMKFGDSLTQKVDMSKVKLDVIKPWITTKITQILGMEDDVVVEFVYNQLEEKFPDPRKMQINLTGFLNGRNARSFMGELWDLLVSAQESVTGIPEAFLQQKKDQIKKRLVIISFFRHRDRRDRDRRSRSRDRRSRSKDQRSSVDRSRDGKRSPDRSRDAKEKMKDKKVDEKVKRSTDTGSRKELRNGRSKSSSSESSESSSSSNEDEVIRKSLERKSSQEKRDREREREHVDDKRKEKEKPVKEESVKRPEKDVKKAEPVNIKKPDPSVSPKKLQSATLPVTRHRKVADSDESDVSEGNTEELEKKLREKALKSMKKGHSIEGSD